MLGLMKLAIMAQILFGEMLEASLQCQLPLMRLLEINLYQKLRWTKRYIKRSCILIQRVLRKLSISTWRHPSSRNLTLLILTTMFLRMLCCFGVHMNAQDGPSVQSASSPSVSCPNFICLCLFLFFLYRLCCILKVPFSDILTRVVVTISFDRSAT